MEKQETIRRLFTSEPYVKSEYQYHRITNKGNVDEQQLHENWTSYLEEYQVISTKFTNTLFDNIIICFYHYMHGMIYNKFLFFSFSSKRGFNLHALRYKNHMELWY